MSKYFELITEIIGWLQIFLSPFLLGIIIGAFVVTVLVGAYEGVVKIFSELPTWLSTILNFAPLIGIIFYVNRNK